MKILANPVFLRMALTFFVAGAAFFLGMFLMRRMRQSISEEASFDDVAPSAETEGFPLHTYHAVIQQLKQQKHELLSMQQVERRRAKTSENISSAVLSNLPNGVMFIGSNGLVRQANAAARQILGFASPAGMSVEDLFRDASLTSSREQRLADVLRSALRDSASHRKLNAYYRTPADEARDLEITITPVLAPKGEFLGAACLVHDQTELLKIRRQQELRGEMSAEMALELRNSLTTISGYAQQLAASRDPDLARQLAADIAAEAAHLDRTIGGFLVEARAAKAAEA